MKKVKLIALIAALIAGGGIYFFLKEVSKPQEIPHTPVVVAAVRSVYPSTSGWYGHSDVREMPSFEPFQSIFDSMPHIVRYSSSVIKDGRSCFKEIIDESVAIYRAHGGTMSDLYRDGLFIYINGDMIFNGYNPVDFKLTFPVTFVVEGNVSLNGTPLEGTIDFPVSVMSKNGSISVYGGVVYKFTGVLYAPRGDVNFYGIDATFVGGIIAQNIYKSGGSFVIRYDEEVDRFLPVVGLHLVE